MPISDTRPIVHRSKEARFTVSTVNGASELLYRQQGNIVDFYRTYVVPADRGHRLARRLVDFGLAWARDQQLDITASCTYVQKVLENNGAEG